MDDEMIPALRVSQLDAATLDSEMENIVGAQLRKCLELIPDYYFSWLEPEMEAGLKSLFWWYVFRPEGSTVGQLMMDMSYRRSNSNLGNGSKWAYFFFTIVLPWLRQRIPSMAGLKGEDWKIRTERTLERASTILDTIDLVHFLWFLNRGGFRSVLERLLRLRSVHNTRPFLGELDSELTERELLWHGFSDILIFFMPLINYRRFYNAVKRLGRQIRQGWTKRKLEEKPGTKLIRKGDILLPCAYCQQIPPTLPCHLGCFHFYCYYCLSANLQVDQNFACLICGYMKSDQGLCFAIGNKIME